MGLVIMNPGFDRLKETIIETGLCTRCGGCQASCPVDAISFTARGVELTGECISCGNCVAICPGGGIDMASHERRLFKKSRKSGFGNRLGIYQKKEQLKAGDEEVFRSGYTGGRVSAVLIHALDKGFIDAALLTDWSGTGDLSIGKGVIARTREEVLSAASSKYVFTPVLNLLKDIRDDSSVKSAALVGLPCHLHAFRKMEVHKGTRDLTSKVTYLIALNCGAANLDEEGWGGLIEELTGVNRSDMAGFSAEKISSAVVRFDVTRRDGKIIKKKIPLTRYLKKILEKGVWPRCKLCPDYSGELSDITFGAPYIRTRKGIDLVESAKNSNDLVRSSTKHVLVQSLTDLTISVRKRSRARKNIRKRKREGQPYPDFSKSGEKG